MNKKLYTTLGTNNKPAISEILVSTLNDIEGLSGQFFTGYPLIATPEGKYSFDAVLISPSKGIIIFDLIEGAEIGDHSERQDDLANKIDAKLRLNKKLVTGRKLNVDISVISFVSQLPAGFTVDNNYPIADENSLQKIIESIVWNKPDDSSEIYQITLSAIENLSNIRSGRSQREVRNENSKGGKLKKLEKSIATLDQRQNKAVIETVDGVQRIRGLAGSGKTIVLAMKAAYLHTQNPEWKIAVTFHTRALKEQFRRLINNFCIEQSGFEPNWDKIKIINAWGGGGSPENSGIYYEFCKAMGITFWDFKGASEKFSSQGDPFDGACKYALENAKKIKSLYNVILIDEAQDFSPSFLRICYSILSENKRLVYAYDELQNLSGRSLPSPEEIFGLDKNGNPLVQLTTDSRQDIILQKCYRNSRPILVSAHGLGFGIYREKPKDKPTGLVQMFDYPNLWKEIGYCVSDGILEKGKHVVLERNHDNSPKFLEDHSEIDELIQFKAFDNKEQHDKWLIEQVKSNLTIDELRHDDIIVINPEPRTTRSNTGYIRSELFREQIQTHLAGVDTSADVFFKTDNPSITFTGIYRAKGNEAGMVYVINAHECNGDGQGLATLRNRLFTAITRSKAWVRVIGYGEKMRDLGAEFQQLKSKNFQLDFNYPTDELLKTLRIVHRDLSEEDKRKLNKGQQDAENLVNLLKSGNLHLEDLPHSLRKDLLSLLLQKD